MLEFDELDGLADFGRDLGGHALDGQTGGTGGAGCRRGGGRGLGPDRCAQAEKQWGEQASEHKDHRMRECG